MPLLNPLPTDGVASTKVLALHRSLHLSLHLHRNVNAQLQQPVLQQLRLVHSEASHCPTSPLVLSSDAKDRDCDL